MTRLALVPVVLALAAAAPHARTAARPVPLVAVRVAVVSGTPQTARAFAAPAQTKYLTDFPQLLTVRVTGGMKTANRRVHFACVTKGCMLAPAAQPDTDNLDRSGESKDDPAAYDVKAIDGKAVLHVIVLAESPAGVYIVRAEPVTLKGERTAPVTFTLTSR